MTAPVRGVLPPAAAAAGRDPAGKAGGGRPLGEQAAVERVARDFAAIFVGELLKLSLPSGGAGWFPSGVAGDLHRDSFVRALAGEIAAAPGFALTARLADALAPRTRT